VVRLRPGRASLVLVAVVVLAACGGGGGGRSAEEREFIDAVIEDFSSGESFPLDRRQAECFGTAFVDAIGYERLEDAGVSAAEFVDADTVEDLGIEPPEGLNDDVADALDDCDTKPALADSLLEEIPLAGEERRCLRDGIVDDPAFADILARVFVGTEDNPAVVLERALAQCPDSIAQLVIEAAGPQLPASLHDCIRREVRDRAGEAARLLASGSQAQQQEFGLTVGQACAAGA
jgi:hypothetical protein